MQVYETGAVFISRLRHYLTYLAEEADLMVYMVSVDIDTDAMSRPVGDFLNGLKSTVNLARQAHQETLTMDQNEENKRDSQKPRPKEVIVITGSAKYQSHSRE